MSAKNKTPPKSDKDEKQPEPKKQKIAGRVRARAAPKAAAAAAAAAGSDDDADVKGNEAKADDADDVEVVRISPPPVAVVSSERFLVFSCLSSRLLSIYLASFSIFWSLTKS